MKQLLLERRTKTLNYLSKGIEPITIIRDFSKEYRVSEYAIRKDIERLPQWAPQVLQLKDDSLAFELANNIKQVIPNAWAEYLKGDNSSARIGALRVVIDATMKLIDVLQSLGKLEKTPERIQTELKAQIVVKMWKPEDEPTS